MSLGNLCLGLFLIFYAVTTFGFFVVPAALIGIVALIAGIIILLAGSQPITIWHRQ